MTKNSDFSKCVIELVDAADAVVRRWHSTSWKDKPTADYINRLNIAMQRMHNLLAKEENGDEI